MFVYRLSPTPPFPFPFLAIFSPNREPVYRLLKSWRGAYSMLLFRDHVFNLISACQHGFIAERLCVIQLVEVLGKSGGPIWPANVVRFCKPKL